MPCKFHIDRDHKLVITTAWETVTGANVLEHRCQLTNDPQFSRDFFQLIDLTQVKEIRIDFLTMATLADDDLFSPRSRRAFIAPHPLAFGMANMFIKLRRPVGNVENREVYEAEEMEIFNSKDEALQWLFRS
jgi:hypothetical protein